jgi:hypothetical protein
MTICSWFGTSASRQRRWSPDLDLRLRVGKAVASLRYACPRRLGRCNQGRGLEGGQSDVQGGARGEDLGENSIVTVCHSRR